MAPTLVLLTGDAEPRRGLRGESDGMGLVVIDLWRWSDRVEGLLGLPGGEDVQ